MHSTEHPRVPSILILLLVLTAFLSACRSSLPSLSEAPIEPVLPPGLSVEPVVSRLARQVAPLLESNIGTQQKTTLLALSGARTYPAIGKRTDAVASLLDPWEGTNQLEAYGLLISALSKHGTDGLDDLLLTLERYRIKSGHPAVSLTPFRGPDRTPPEVLAALLQEVKRLTERASRNLSMEDKRFLFERPARFIDDYRPQTADPNSQTKFVLYSNRRFIQLLQELSTMMPWSPPRNWPPSLPASIYFGT